MAQDLNIALIINAAGNAARELKKIKGEVKGAVRNVTTFRDRWRDTATHMKATATKMKSQFSGAMKIFAGVGIVGKLADDYETGLAKISTLTDMSMEKVEERWGSAFKTIASESGEGINTITEGAYQALSASVKQKDLAKFIGIATKTAVGGFTDVKTAVDGISSVMNSWGGDAKQIADIFLNTQNLGKTTVGEIASSIGKIAPIASNLGVKFEEVSSAIATMTATGSKTPEALTAVRATIVGFAKATEKQKKALAKLKLTKQFTLDTIASKGYAETLKMLMDRIKKTSKSKKEMAAMAQAIFGRVEGLNALFALTSEKGLKKYNEAMEINKKNTDSVNKAAAKMNKARTFKKMKVQIQLLAIEIGKVLLPAIKKFADALGPLVDNIKLFAAEHPELVKWIGRLAIGLGAIKLAMWALSGPMTMIAAHPLVAAIVGITLAFVSLTGASEDFNNVVDDVLHPAFSWLEEKAQSVYDNIMKLYNGAKKILSLATRGSGGDLVLRKAREQGLMKDFDKKNNVDTSPAIKKMDPKKERELIKSMSKKSGKKISRASVGDYTDIEQNYAETTAGRNVGSGASISDNSKTTINQTINIQGTNATPQQIAKAAGKAVSQESLKDRERKNAAVTKAQKRRGF